MSASEKSPLLSRNAVRARESIERGCDIVAICVIVPQRVVSSSVLQLLKPRVPPVIVTRIVDGDEILQGVLRHVPSEHCAVPYSVLDGLANLWIVWPFCMPRVNRSCEVIVRHHEETVWSRGGLCEWDAPKIA
mgnify:CR=1 FL=1